MKQKWHDLLFADWPLPPEKVRPLVPQELELDLREGAFVGSGCAVLDERHPRTACAAATIFVEILRAERADLRSL